MKAAGQGERTESRGYSGAISRVVVSNDEWVSQYDSADVLGIGLCRIGLLIANGHFVAAEDSDGRAGVEAASVERELARRSSASLLRPAGRMLRDFVRWF